MLSNIEWDQDNAGRIATESLKQIQQVCLIYINQSKFANRFEFFVRIFLGTYQ